ncbi:helix-turn-helix domain-containing protein [Glutamicibacter sp. AOP5-A2-18]|uniref:helix-turn-helix domain-containing protein n=1 Tax=Glutamicibacter sp. AOP5-A2-18 TaxID=3457656 RepID=UPI004034853D
MKLRNPQVLRELTKTGTDRRITISQLARKSEVSEGMIYHLLNRRHEVTVPVAQRIASAAGVRYEVLFLCDPMNSKVGMSE